MLGEVVATVAPAVEAAAAVMVAASRLRTWMDGSRTDKMSAQHETGGRKSALGRLLVRRTGIIQKGRCSLWKGVCVGGDVGWKQSEREVK